MGIKKKSSSIFRLLLIFIIVGLMSIPVVLHTLFGTNDKNKKTSFELAVDLEKDKKIMDLENALEACQNGR